MYLNVVVSILYMIMKIIMMDAQAIVFYENTDSLCQFMLSCPFIIMLAANGILICIHIILRGIRNATGIFVVFHIY